MQTAADGTFLWVNRTFCRWVGQSPTDLVGRLKFQDLLNMGGRIFHQTHWAPLLSMQGSLSEVKLEIACRDGVFCRRVNVDVADYKKQRAERLGHTAEDWVKQVKESGEAMELKPMNASDRRIVHQLAGEFGLSTESVGEGRDRHIILKPSAE